ncbi:hypothetical protein EIJ81_00290 (plasmid) [Aliivibrio salmonicida]|uniref:hypothetical protein n=1 Tax=Aliivibrio salmonicida TaxID=40269 RepID=UPI000F6BC560|nr:hypothetical protein [Aliivibrio salmonicida]AZL83341.1 hypothetical protein EIJ81_00290 [Aliivibrio salmonicida]
MNTIEKHDVWELDVDGFEQPVLASFLIEYMSSETHDEVIAQSILKSHIATQAVEGKIYAKCGTCNCPVNFIARNATTEAHFRHISSKAPDVENMKMCSFYTGTESFFGSVEIYKREGQWHFKTKHFLAEHIRNVDGFKNVNVEKFIFSKDPMVDSRRRPDIAFEDADGNRFVIDLIRWWMNPEVVYQREKFFREEEINLIWLFSPRCEELNATTMNMILFGSASSREGICPDILSRVECNVFILSDAALMDMSNHKRITFDALYPFAYFDEQELEVVVEKRQKLVDINSLNLEPTKRLPFSIQTSSSFKEAIKAQTNNERKNLYELYKTLRRLVYADILFKLESDETDCLDLVDAAVLSCKSSNYKRQVYKYAKIVKSKVENAKAERINRLKRNEAAVAIRGYRKTVLNLFRAIQSSEREKDVLILQERIQNVFNRSSDYHSSLFLSFFERVELKVKSRLSEIQVERIKINSINQRSMENHINEMNAFVSELECGFDNVVADADKLNIKKIRIARDARKYGFIESAEYLESLYCRVMNNTQKAYWEREYPYISKGWSSESRYKLELDKAFMLISMQLHRRDPKRKQIEAYQKSTHVLLIDFSKALQEYVQLTHSKMIKADQPSLSSLVSCEQANLKRVRGCLEYLKANGIDSHYSIWEQLGVIEKGINAVNNGTPLYLVINELANSKRST